MLRWREGSESVRQQLRPFFLQICDAAFTLGFNFCGVRVIKQFAFMFGLPARLKTRILHTHTNPLVTVTVTVTY
jgi:hypothetical protein